MPWPLRKQFPDRHENDFNLEFVTPTFFAYWAGDPRFRLQHNKSGGRLKFRENPWLTLRDRLIEIFLYLALNVPGISVVLIKGLWQGFKVDGALLITPTPGACFNIRSGAIRFWSLPVGRRSGTMRRCRLPTWGRWIW